MGKWSFLLRIFAQSSCGDFGPDKQIVGSAAFDRGYALKMALSTSLISQTTPEGKAAALN
jgi:hypothetical protein